MVIQPDGFRFGFFSGSGEIAAPHAASGILAGGSALSGVAPTHCSATQCTFTGKSSTGDPVTVEITLAAHDCTMTVRAAGASILVRTAGLAPAYGLGDR